MGPWPPGTCHIPGEAGCEATWKFDFHSLSPLPPLLFTSPFCCQLKCCRGILNSNRNVGGGETELKVGSKGRDQAGGSLAFPYSCLPYSSLQPHPQEEEVAGPILQAKKQTYEGGNLSPREQHVSPKLLAA